ncbi:YnfA family protein [Marivirga sp. S37H4]|uniref:YnfA family protein n=1 Tax=Marivirga aurantiaca TaxID=2802615 RepID=A0A934WYR8_9BACT|nr:YnfA family protein [Marivirga aurantiaca]MBK6265367.1 YnfA family protein [Marivirga aurantiaca]
MKDILLFLSAAVCEIFGCYTFWLYLRLNKSIYWVIPGILSLMVFAFLLTKVQSEFAGRAYAVYGGIYIVSSLSWLYFVENIPPDKWDIIGASVCIIGAMIILFMPR